MNYKYNQFKHGQKATCVIGDEKITDAKISIESGGVFICQDLKNGNNCSDKLGYKFSWILLEKNKDFEEGYKGVTKLKLSNRTIEDVQEGDLIKDRSGDFCRVLGVVGKVVFMSYTWSKDEDEIEKYGLGYSISELKDYGYTLVDEETPKETITIAGHTYSKKEVEERLKDLEEV